MPRVTVRLGALTRSDGRWAQKGVDAAMHAELTELARNRACSDIVLVTGDGDLLPGMMAAKEHGVAVHLWAVQAADGDYNQSEDLVAEADERRVLDREWITRAVRAREATGVYGPAAGPEIAAILSAPLPEAAPHPGPAKPPAPAAAPSTAAAGRNGGHAPAPTAEPAAKPGVPTPKDLAELGRGSAAAAHAGGTQPAATLRWSSEKGWIERPPTADSTDAVLPTLAQLTT